MKNFFEYSKALRMKETRTGKICRCISELGFWNALSLFRQLLFNKSEVKFYSKKLTYPIYLRKGTSDFSIFYNIFVKREYEINYGEKISTIIDLGANIGLATVFFKNLYPDCMIISVEPEKRNFKILEQNTSLYKNVVLINSAIWNEATDLFIENTKHGEWGFMVSKEPKMPEQSIRSITIDQIIHEYEFSSIDILKIDIEGSEKDLFQKNFQQWLPITKRIVIELHDGMRPGSSKAFFSAIVGYDFSVALVGENIVCTINQ